MQCLEETNKAYNSKESRYFHGFIARIGCCKILVFVNAKSKTRAYTFMDS
jgi:hypothetical protein